MLDTYLVFAFTSIIAIFVALDFSKLFFGLIQSFIVFEILYI